MSGAPCTTVSPTFASTSTTTPAASAATTCSIFMDSMTTSGCDGVTASPGATVTVTTVPCRGDVSTTRSGAATARF